MKSPLRLTCYAALFLCALPLRAQQAPASRGRLSLPDKSWALVLDLSGFSVTESEIKPDGRRYLKANNEKTGVVFSVFLEETDPRAKARNCRETLQARVKESPLHPKEIKLYESGEMEFLEYLIPEYLGVKIRQQNLFACIFRDATFIDLHFSKASFQPGEEKLFQDVLHSLRFDEGIRRTSQEYFEFGSMFYLQGKYERAIGPYEKALDLEKKNPALSKTLWKVLVDNLGMAYGVTHNLTQAKETFEYGLSIEAAYPIFHYNLACTYAEMNDAQNAAASLKKAFQYQQNLIPGERMPDPRKDSSFQRLMKDAQFKDLAESLVSAPIQSLETGIGKQEPANSNGEPAVRGTLTDSSGPIADAEIILESLQDAKCANLFQSKEYSEKKVRQLAACAKDLPSVTPDSQGRFQFTNLHPGWYVMRFLWSIAQKPETAPASFVRSGFVIGYAGRKDKTGRYDTMAQGTPFYFQGKEDFVLVFSMGKP